MNFSRETMEKVNRFAKEQSQSYLEDAEMTYIEKLHRKGGQTMHKINRKLAKFRVSSDRSQEAQNDMTLYMCDYMNDLILKGMSEQEAYDKASEEMRIGGTTQQSADLYERYKQYFETADITNYEAVGVFYGGFLFIGIAAGGLIGFLAGGGRELFLDSGWIDTLIGVGFGSVFGIGLGEIVHGIIVYRSK